MLWFFQYQHTTYTEEYILIYRHVILPLTLAASLSGCIDVPADAIVTDYNGASVKVQVSSFSNHETALASAMAEAKGICSKAGKPRVEYASERSSGDYLIEMLFICT